MDELFGRADAYHRAAGMMRQEATMDSFVWIVGPIAVALFGFLFWLAIGKFGSDRPGEEESEQDADHPAPPPDE